MAPCPTADVGGKQSVAERETILKPVTADSNGISTYDLTATNTVTSVRWEAML